MLPLFLDFLDGPALHSRKEKVQLQKIGVVCGILPVPLSTDVLSTGE